MERSKHCIFLTGAPDGAALEWDEQGLLSSLQPAAQRFLRIDRAASQQPTTPSPTGLPAKWRSISSDDLDARIPDQAPDPSQASSVNAANDLEDYDFLEHSIAILDNLDTSQIISTTAEEIDVTEVSFVTSSLTDTSFQTTDASFATVPTTQDKANAVVLSIQGGITDLKSLPKADHITRILPQTITANLLAGIISISPPRTVRLHRRNAEMDIIELTVGDETRAGFAISFWVTRLQSQKSSDDSRESLLRLRPGAVVLIQNVALTCWKGNVYGQSLSKRFARNSTTISVFGKNMRQALSTPVMSKLQRVQDWTADFVGVEPVAKSASDGRKKRKTNELPPDTQD